MLGMFRIELCLQHRVWNADSGQPRRARCKPAGALAAAALACRLLVNCAVAPQPSMAADDCPASPPGHRVRSECDRIRGGRPLRDARAGEQHGPRADHDGSVAAGPLQLRCPRPGHRHRRAAPAARRHRQHRQRRTRSANPPAARSNRASSSPLCSGPASGPSSSRPRRTTVWIANMTGDAIQALPPAGAEASYPLPELERRRRSRSRLTGASGSPS